ncbi:MAG: ABC transporter substrate-binding protein [Candidatus Promineifilaceae bacterium]
MRLNNKGLWRATLLLVVLLLASCRDSETEEPTQESPLPTSTATTTAESIVTPEVTRNPDFITVVIDAPSRFRDFADIDQFGNVVGFDPDVMADLAATAGFDYEFVVTSFSGLLNSVANGEFDAAMSALLIPDQPEEGVAYTNPYLEVGQVLLVRANEEELTSYTAIRPGVPIGVQRFSSGEQTAREIVGLAEPELQLYGSSGATIQALINNEVEGAIIDSDDAEHFATLYPQQLKIAGGEGEAAWISHKRYGIAVAADNQDLLNKLNEAIATYKENGTLDTLTLNWLVTGETIAAGESLVGTPPDELVIGMAGELADMDPAAREPDLIGWEVKSNTMSGLYMYDGENNLLPILAADMPTISEDGLEYTIPLRSNLIFPDGSDLTAEDVKFSVLRAARLGNVQVNGYLKDANDDGFADEDSIQLPDAQHVKFVLQEPIGYFPSLLATPPYFVVSEDCFPAGFDATTTCGGLGKYTVLDWQPGVQMQLRANPDYPGAAPAFENLQLRFYSDPAQMRLSLENNAIDIAWTGLPISDAQALRNTAGFTYWEGPAAFKSYLVFEQSEDPWDNARMREAISFAVDREALAAEVFNNVRRPLYSPIPTGTPGQVATEATRDLSSAQAILMAVGYSPGNKLDMTIWYVNDGRYTPLEQAYAEALAAQIEETDLIDVTVEGAPWAVFRPQSLACEYPAYLLGWPSSGQPAAYLDALSWMEYFITNTDQICSNYESPAMDALLESARAETDTAARLEIYRQIQELWAREYPTLDLTEEPRYLLSADDVQNVTIDAMGLLHYDLLTKG